MSHYVNFMAAVRSQHFPKSVVSQKDLAQYTKELNALIKHSDALNKVEQIIVSVALFENMTESRFALTKSEIRKVMMHVISECDFTDDEKVKIIDEYFEDVTDHIRDFFENH